MKWQMMFDHVFLNTDGKEKVAKKFSKLETYLGRMRSRVESGFVRLSRGDRFGYKVQTKFRLPGKDIVAEGKSTTLLSAIDRAYEKASREMRSYLERIKEQRKS